MRAAGSMDTTISDFRNLPRPWSWRRPNAASRAEMTKPQLHITTAHQFPPLARSCRSKSSERICMRGSASSSSMARRATASQGRPRRPDRQHHGLHRGQPALRSDSSQRRPRRSRLRGAGQVSSSATPACPMTGNTETTPENLESPKRAFRARGRPATRTYRKRDLCRKIGGLERLLLQQLLRKRRYPMDETALRDFKQRSGRFLKPEICNR